MGYAPVTELQERTDVSVYFPEGTFCHQEGSVEYYCRKNTCVSSERGSRADSLNDVQMYQGARPDGDLAVPPELKRTSQLIHKVNLWGTTSSRRGLARYQRMRGQWTMGCLCLEPQI